MNKSKSTKRKSNRKKLKDHMQEFSKFVVVAMAIMWIIAGFFLLWVIYYQLTTTYSPEYISAEVIATYFCAPMTAGLIGYFCKAAFENKEKIKTAAANSPIEEVSAAENDTITKG